jgi:hypothetical protein
MSIPTQPRPSQPPPSGQKTLLIIVLVLLVLLLLGCCGAICAGMAAYLSLKPEAMRSVPQLVTLPNVAVTPGENDWFTSRTLAPVYTTAIDTVSADKKVIEWLGEPIEPVERSDGELYRRKQPEADSDGSETIEFDIKGPKGRGMVTAVARGGSVAFAAPPGGAGPDDLRVTMIRVTLKDGAVIDVPPPSDQPAFVPIR